MKKQDKEPFTIFFFSDKKERKRTKESLPKEINLEFWSFGFKYGVNEKSYWKLFNLQKLPNPAFSLRKNETGISSDLQKDFFAISSVMEMYQKIKSEIQEDLKKVKVSDLKVMIGCHSGKHRSVAFVERLAKEDFGKIKVLIIHRDIDQKGFKKDFKQERKSLSKFVK